MSFCGFKIVFLFLISFAVSGYGNGIFVKEDEGVKARIVGGRNSDIVNHPYQVSIRNSTGEHMCGGAIISKLHILTAGHCVSEINPPFDTHFVTSGTSSSLPNNGERHVIKAIAVHPFFATEQKMPKNDIAVITLSQPIVLSSVARVVQLPTDNANQGDIGVLTGWGATYTGGKTTEQLQGAQMIISPSTVCFSVDKFYTSSKLCATNRQGIGACFGDSGGPLVIDGKVIGICSYITESCGSGSPDIYTNVFSFLAFINPILQQEGQEQEEEQVSTTPLSTLPSKKRIPSYRPFDIPVNPYDVYRGQPGFHLAWQDPQFLDHLFQEYVIQTFPIFKKLLKTSRMYIKDEF